IQAGSNSLFSGARGQETNLGSADSFASDTLFLQRAAEGISGSRGLDAPGSPHEGIHKLNSLLSSESRASAEGGAEPLAAEDAAASFGVSQTTNKTQRSTFVPASRTASAKREQLSLRGDNRSLAERMREKAERRAQAAKDKILEESAAETVALRKKIQMAKKPSPLERKAKSPVEESAAKADDNAGFKPKAVKQLELHLQQAISLSPDHAAVKIQAWLRGVNVRKDFHNHILSFYANESARPSKPLMWSNGRPELLRT
ncbi:unnamed protein product, partial [Amoebophrya sp. A25]